MQDAFRRVIVTASQYAARQLEDKAALTAAADDWQPPPEGVLLSFTLTQSLLRLQRIVTRQTAERALSAAGVEWTPESVAQLLGQTEAWTGQAVEDALQPQLQKLVADAFADGLPVKDAAALIRTSFAETSVWQSEMLARSTLNMLSNAANQTAVDAYNARAKATGRDGFSVKRWVTANDAKVRDTHRAASGQEVPVDQPFQVGGAALRFPGDPGGPLREVLNCRCTTIFVEQEMALAAAATRMEDTMAVTVTVEEQAETGTEIGWVSDMAFEGVPTGDGRFILPDAITWRELPIPLMLLAETGRGGHEGAHLAGKITEIVRDSEADMNGDPLPEGVIAIRGRGVFAGPDAESTAALVRDEIVHGISLDPGQIVAVLRDPDTGEVTEPRDLSEEQFERLMFGELQTAFKVYEIGGATVCPIPAFADARIEIASGALVHLDRYGVTVEGISQPSRSRQLFGPIKIVEEALTASAAGLAPLKPPADWFAAEEADQPTPLTVTPEGRVFGHIAVWNSCHTGRPGQCFQPPRSPSGYAYFNLGEIECQDGTRVPCGQITLDTGHAPISASGEKARRHYDHTGVCAADIRASDGAFGIWVSGAIRPHITAQQARALMCAKPSGDWRTMTPGGPLELVGVLAVNVPGYPVPRPQMTMVASAAHPEGEPVALVAAGTVDEDAFDRQLRVLAARAEGGIDGLAQLAEGAA